MADFRSFRNADLPELVNVFRQHHSLSGRLVQVTEAQFELAILARNFFRSENLVVAVEPRSAGKEALVGWCHVGIQPEVTGETDPIGPTGKHTVVAAMCFSDQCESSTATQLLGEVSLRSDNWGAPLRRAGLYRDDRFGYSGLDPYGHGYGVDRSDARLQSALESSGFIADQSIMRVVACLDSYRPAFSRESMQLRRSASIQQKRVLPETVRQAAALSHLDIERHALVERSGSVIGGTDFWFSDSEAQVMSPSHAIVSLPPLTVEGQLPPTDSHLISTVVGTLGDRGVHQVETSILASQAILLEQVTKIGFTPTDEGYLWKRG